MATSTHFLLEVNPRLPPQLSRLSEIASNLWYCWSRPTRHLLARLHPQLWDAVSHSPTAFLKQIDESRLLQALDDESFMRDYREVCKSYDDYHADTDMRIGAGGWRQDDRVAYFCAEFGFHESLPIYSGGLGILAGDHCKAASDARVPLIGVGLLYRQGFFTQTIDAAGNQVVSYADSDFANLPVAPAMVDGKALTVSVDFPGRSVTARVWQARAGHVGLYFLDTDSTQNSDADRDITYRLYGGDRRRRLEQEIILGVGGVRALNALGITPAAWHINEGHAAFLILERARVLTAAGMTFAAAMEQVAANVVFTTHTPVPAGHDHFDAALLEQYFADFSRGANIDFPALFALGRSDGSPEFNMTALAARGSRFRNAVSRVHCGVASQMLGGLWPQIPPEENPIDYVTNGVHVATFLAPEWADTFERHLGDRWHDRAGQREWLERLLDVPDHVVWALHQRLKSKMLHLVRHRVSVQNAHNHGSEAHAERMLRLANPDSPDVLTIGFARRFATYKRAALLFQDRERLLKLMSQSNRPVLLIFAGKAHPADLPGQAVIHEIAEIARTPEFEDKVLLLEGYDLHLARRLVSGVDVWLNNPLYPLEASGTSGMKAGMNGVLNLSVLDGWWAEGYERGNGWAVKPVLHEASTESRDRQEARALYEILEDQIIPLYYARDDSAYSKGWARMAKHSIATILPRFNATRMLSEYLHKFYMPAAGEHHRFHERPDDATQLAAWKDRVRSAWPHVAVRRVDTPQARIVLGETITLEVMVRLAGLSTADLAVEVTFTRALAVDDVPVEQKFFFRPDGDPADGWQRFVIPLAPEFCGRLDYVIRIYPTHHLLTHRFELGLMVAV